MAVRTLALVGCALLACGLVGGGYPQTPPAPAPAAGPLELLVPQITPVAQPAPPPPKTVDQLIENLTELRRQKAELEKKEHAVTAELRGKLKEQRERLAKLGIEPAPIPPQVPGIPDAPPASGATSIPVIPSPAGDR